MLKRQYFIHVELWENDQIKSKHFRQFYVKSLFPRSSAQILNDKLDELADRIGVDKDHLHVTAFNRSR